ncbi:12794_t:CDS:2, partial [Funneliformis geosporum]
VDLADNAGGLPAGKDQIIGYLRVVINRRTAVQIEANGINKAFNQPGNIIVKLRIVE